MSNGKKKQKIITIRLDERALKDLDAAVTFYNARGANANRCHLIRIAVQEFLDAKRPTLLEPK